MRLFKLGLLAGAIAGTSAKKLWSNSPANITDIIQSAYPVGNGRLGAMPAGPPNNQVVNLNLDSLWTGGPFENKSYDGGNPPGPVYEALPGIRDWIFKNGTGNVSELLGGEYSYGSYSVLANLTVQLDGVDNYTDYTRQLHLDTAFHTISFNSSNQTFVSLVFCSYPDNVCVYNIQSSSTLPTVSIGLENVNLNSSLAKSCCSENQIKFDGHLESQTGMQFRSTARLLPENGTAIRTFCQNSTLVIPSSNRLKMLTLVFAAGTDYDQTKGNAENDFSFKGADPGPYVEGVVSAAARKTLSQLASSHQQDYQRLFKTFTLDLPDTKNSSGLETATIIDSYTVSVGDPFVESLLFDYGRYLLISSSRDNSLPANLQGRWSPDPSAAWSADYHANINLQMNYWPAPQTGLGDDTQNALWSYMANTWVPYGEITAELLYGAGNGSWVTHDEMNIFGYTAIKEEAQWANYPASAAWMMHHVTDWFDYSQDVSWYQKVGYPLLKGVAQFWLLQLQEDRYFNDGTLVVNPCNSPEHGPTTFGCTHYQQLIWELFDRILSTWSSTGDTDEFFHSQIQRAFTHLDRGIHVGNWGQLQEWKLDIDTPNDTHRHLSHLYGWYPGYSISGTPASLNTTVVSAVETTLWSRGNGSGTDADSGWEKVWRSACWAVLNDTERAYFELSFAIDENFEPENGLSMYWALYTPFQIDANFGLVGAMLAMLVRDLPLPWAQRGGVRTVVLGPAIPKTWGGGKVEGLRIRGGGVLGFSWDQEGIVKEVKGTGVDGRSVRIVNVLGEELSF